MRCLSTIKTTNLSPDKRHAASFEEGAKGVGPLQDQMIEKRRVGNTVGHGSQCHRGREVMQEARRSSRCSGSANIGSLLEAWIGL